MIETKSFIHEIRRYYTAHARSFPWRHTKNPYRILVSEVMLQQTQVSRVVGKYREFLKKFPNIKALSEAKLIDVLRVWQGLGYNRRAKYLHELAKEVVVKHGGKIPRQELELLKLPGMGPATTAAVQAFAFNMPSVYLDTNVRSVYLHYFFPKQKNVPDATLLPLIELTLDRKHPREWYYALLDYGAHVKQIGENPGRRSTHYTRQSKFAGSSRQLRGQIISILLAHGPLSQRAISERLETFEELVVPLLEKLARDGLLQKKRRKYQIA